MKRFLFLSFAIALLSAKSFAQGEIPVDMYTGTPRIEIPLGGVASHDLSDGLSLAYNARGIKLNETAGHYGIGWELQAGGTISREVRGLPDDYYPIYPVDPRRGWLNTRASKSISVSQEVSGFGNTSDLSTATCSDELSDYNAIHDFVSSVMDTQPDLFSFSVGGYSGKFVFDNSLTPQVRLIPYQDIKIEPVFGTSNKILAFTLTTNTGIVYQLNAGSSETRKIIPISTNVVESATNDYNLYSNSSGPILFAYSTTWELSTTTSPAGDAVSYVYDAATYTLNDTVKVSVKKNGAPGYVLVKLYIDQRTVNFLHLVYINASKSGASIILNYDAQTTLFSSVVITDKRASADQLTDVTTRQYNFTYFTNSYGRSYLKTVTEASANGAETMPPYELNYFFENLPSTNSKAKDLWGYYNGKKNTDLAPALYVYPGLPPAERYRIYPMPPSYSGFSLMQTGADRAVDTALVKAGSLKSVRYPAGGSTQLVYEANQYYDSIAGQNFYGGGVRIKTLTYDDGINTQGRIVKRFTYKTSGTELSSGRLIQRPVFAIPVYEYRDPLGSHLAYPPELEDPAYTWDYFTVRSEQDLSGAELRNESAVGYKEVRVARPGSGYVNYEFRMPATYGFTTAAGDWQATVIKPVRSSLCKAMGVIDAGGAFLFPYAPNPDFSYERGLVTRQRDYTQGGILVRDTQTTYQYLYKSGSTPVKVWGLIYGNFPNESSANAYLAGKYYLLTETAKLMAKETVITLDENAQAKNNVEKTEYFYESTQNKLLTRLVQTTSDGVIYQSKMRYASDYASASTPDKASQMIDLMKTTSRHGLTIERYQTIQRPGDTEKIISGSVMKHNDFGLGLILPQYQLSWHALAPLPVTSFTPSSVNTTTGIFTVDPGYEITTMWLDYDSYGKPRTVRGVDSVTSTKAWGFSTTVPVVAVSGARSGQFAFSDFETTTSASFDLAVNNTYNDGVLTQVAKYNPGRTGRWRISTYTTLSKTLSKAENKYRISGWWAKASQTMNVLVTIKNAAKTVSYPLQTFSISAADPDATYEYFEKEVAIDASLTDFYVEITFSLADMISSTTVDDIAFYPVSAQLVSSTYTFPFGKEATTVNDQTGFTLYDGLGRVNYVLDRNRNILQKNSYKFATR